MSKSSKKEKVKRKKPIIEDLEIDDTYGYELHCLHNYDEVINMSNSEDYPLLDTDYDDISTKYYEYKGRNYPRKVFNNINVIDEAINIGKEEN